MAQMRIIPYHEVQGFKMPIRFLADRFIQAISYTPESGDIFLGSYPKTGSTWLQYIVYLVMNNGNSPDDVAHLLSSTPYVQRDGFDLPGQSSKHKIIALKYQMPFRFVPYSSLAKYIYISRNPKDTCVSFYHFCKMVPGCDFQNGTFDDFFESFITGDLPFGSYFDNVVSWYEHLKEPNFCFVTYEEMKLDLKGVIVRIAKFLDRELSEKIVDKIVHYSSFQYMKSHVNSHLEEYLNSPPDTFNLGQLKDADLFDGSRRKQTPGPALVRKGVVGDWKFYFSPEQNERMNQMFINETSFTNVSDLWPDIMRPMFQARNNGNTMD